MEFLYVIIGIVFIVAVIFSFTYFYVNKKTADKPPVKFKIEVINAKIYFNDSLISTMEEVFEGEVYKKLYPCYTKLMYFHEQHTAQAQFNDFLTFINERGFIAIDNNTLIPVEKILKIDLIRSNKVIEVEGV